MRRSKSRRRQARAHLGVAAQLVRFLRNKTGKPTPMAIHHLSVKAVSRSAGRSATAAAAYRAGCSITDERTGEIHDYTRKGGVESADIVLPDGAPEWATDRAKLWNAAELAEKRKDACVAREFEVALPSELTPSERWRLALDFARDMANREGCVVDVAIHAPGKEGDNRNHHAHILRTTRKVEADGLGAKLDTEKAGRKRSDDLEAVRAKWADMTNERLRENGIAARVDHRSLEAQGIDREPTKHLGPAASGYERRTGQPSDKRIQQEREAVERLTRAKALGELERQSRQSDRLILDLSGDLAAAKAERDRQPAPEVKQAAASGVADFRAQFEQAKQVEAGKQQALEAFQRFKAEQQQAEQAKQQAAERTTQELARQRQEAKRQAEVERQQAEQRERQRQEREAKEQEAQALAKQREDDESKQQAEQERRAELAAACGVSLDAMTPEMVEWLAAQLERDKAAQAVVKDKGESRQIAREFVRKVERTKDRDIGR